MRKNQKKNVRNTRKDKLKNKAKVIKEVLKNPEKTQREIAKSTNISKSTVNRNLQEVGQIGTQSDIIDKILQDDKEIMKLANGETLKRLQEMFQNGEIKNLYDLKIL